MILLLTDSTAFSALTSTFSRAETSTWAWWMKRASFFWGRMTSGTSARWTWPTGSSITPGLVTNTITQSRIDVKKCVFNKRTIKVCVSCCWLCPGTSAPSAAHLTVSLYLCSSGSNARGELRAQLSELTVAKNCWQRNFITTLKLRDGAYFQTIPFFVK